MEERTQLAYSLEGGCLPVLTTLNRTSQTTLAPASVDLNSPKKVQFFMAIANVGLWMNLSSIWGISKHNTLHHFHKPKTWLTFQVPEMSQELRFRTVEWTVKPLRVCKWFHKVQAWDLRSAPRELRMQASTESYYEGFFFWFFSL